LGDYLALAAGVVLAGIGGELFLVGVAGLARWARISARLVATSVAAFATSSPELTIAITSALAGEPEISLGDALGSNLANVAIVLACAALVAPIDPPSPTLGRDFRVAAAASFGVGGLALDGEISRLDGLLLLAAFAVWATALLREAKSAHGAEVPVPEDRRAAPAMLLGVVGFALLLVAGHWVVRGAEGIASRLGADLFWIGATVVAVGTSIPELAVSVTSQIRRKGEIGLGTVLGSNIFNALFIVGLAALICPIQVAWRGIGLTLLFGIAALVMVHPGRPQRIGRGHGAILLALYAAYTAVIVASA
jgi:cation:H+ antiporter